MAPVVDTVLFVDIDGVLNVGIRDHGNAPLLLNDSNVKTALMYKDYPFKGASAEQECITKVASVVDRCLGNDKSAGTYRDLACGSKEHCSSVLVERLAEIIRAAGDASIVLSSNWRRPKYANRVRSLEKEVSVALGSEFKFDARTEDFEETGASDRLYCIGNYVRRLCAERERAGVRGPLRALLLDDFFVSPLDGWGCGGATVYSTAEAEGYVRRCAPEGAADVKLVHCYDEWRTDAGLRVQVGTGLTQEDVKTAKAFLAAPQEENPCVEFGKQACALAELAGAQVAIRKDAGDYPGTVGSEMVATLGVCWTGVVSVAFPWLCFHL
uniref:Uncharacterized protein n=1 Tax=Zooxanthella nutricula TaxID=1333877 RepID=A0A6U6N6L6_9DINO|mmetsp:Transcript_45990/g.139451  ORF Transcript_45990/g.139451 Transcript_45990/m.139451 type:complete len:326 (+) Transcript_45990:52-1029(+)